MASRPMDEDDGQEKSVTRERLSKLAMFVGLGAAYGTLAAMMARFLYPARPSPRGWMFVANVSEFDVGTSRVYRTPSGETVNITKQRGGGAAADFVALSSVCPHLGCQVHWEAQNSRYFCPCHNGAFDPSGVATGGPPADAGQSLPEYGLKVEGALLFVDVPLGENARAPGALEPCDPSHSPPGPGHDPCLYERKA